MDACVIWGPSVERSKIMTLNGCAGYLMMGGIDTKIHKAE
jgi:hypothetical protein